ncbi:lipoprotein insertase outer membrane protein LolB [Lysobacter sp. TAF61]|uniref:lipoprotein insertase outer membrane protein LolB n=1 Tax=Lysobacter sp. TAF61 TaxID=3233072 RepID=UPI003F97D0D8
MKVRTAFAVAALVRVMLTAVLSLGVLSGCASTTTRAPAVPVDTAQAHANDQRRGEVRDWTLSGRIAVSNGKQGGSGRIDWQEQQGRYDISLSAPVTRQSWRLSGDGGGARLEGVEGGTRESADVESMLQATTGWDVPVRALSDWVRGIGATSAGYGPASIEYGAGNLPSRLQQGGWTIEYQQWQPAADGPVLPTRLVATRGQAKVRLIVDQWSLGAGK